MHSTARTYLVELLGISVNTDGGEDSLDVVGSWVSLTTEGGQEVSSYVSHSMGSETMVTWKMQEQNQQQGNEEKNRNDAQAGA